jgi:hypothetical protein
MQITQTKIEIGKTTHPEIIFLRVTPENMESAIRQTLNELADLSWLNKLSDETLRIAFEKTASETISNLKVKVENDENIGEYLVSHLARKAIKTKLGHEEIPLMELLSRRVSGAEGFDFYTEKLSENLIVCGEAKYVKNRNSYGSSIEQIVRFVREQKHIKDITLIVNFTAENSRKKLVKGEHGVCAAFSSTSIDSTQLINNMKANVDLHKLFDKKLILLVAVDIA